MEIWITITLIISISVVFLGYFFFTESSKKSLHRALEKALEAGQDISPELLQTLKANAFGRFGDLRKAILWLVAGVATGIANYLTPEFEYEENLVTLFPLLIGLGYLVIWKLNPNKNQ